MFRRYVLIGLGCLILANVGSVIAQTQTPTPTPTPESITDADDQTGLISSEALTFILEAAEGQELDSPMTLDLPEDWVWGNGTALIEDVLGFKILPFTIFTGPVTGGEGFIVLIWGYESIGSFNSETGESNLSPYNDALRLLHFALIGPDCVPGVDVERDYEIGGMTVRGSNFAAYRCEETVDTRGWFVGLSIENVNMGIYAYTEPIEAMDGKAPQELQAILDTAEFDMPSLYQRMQERYEQLLIEATATAQAQTLEPTATP